MVDCAVCHEKVAGPRKTLTGDPMNARLHAGGFAVVLGLIVWVLLPSLDSAPYSPTSDDGYYLHFMDVVSREGVSAFPELFAAWNANPRDWLYPPPLRIGFIIASAGWAKLFGASLEALSWLSFGSHLAWTSINWLFSRRRMGEGFALLLAASCGFSPLLLGLGRLALMDSFTCLCVTLALWLVLEMLEQPSLLVWRVLFGVAFAFAILTKELSVLIALPVTACVLLERFVHEARLSLWRFAATLASPPC
jgi:4-amino-4-deoxy-L-arabinose transferase-like glycosyltransferase